LTISCAVRERFPSAVRARSFSSNYASLYPHV
jgi:hypothetical protein